MKNWQGVWSKSSVAALGLSLLVGASVATAQGSRGSGSSTDPLYAIASGLDPLTGLPQQTPFTNVQPFAPAPTTALPGGTPIFISDAELGQTGAFAGTPGANAGLGFVQPTTTGTGFGTTGAAFGTGSVGGSGNMFISDAELTGGAPITLTNGFGAAGGFGTTDAIVGRLPGNLPIVGPEYANEIPGIGLSVVQPIQSVTEAEAQNIQAQIAAGNTGFTTSGVGPSGSIGVAPQGLPLPARRGRSGPYISGNVIARQLGLLSGEPDRASPVDNGQSDLQTSAQTTALNQRTNEDGQLVSTSHQQVPQALEEAVNETLAADLAPQAPAVQDTATAAPAAASGSCSGLTLSFSDDSPKLTEEHKRTVRNLITSCSGNADAVYKVVSHQDNNSGDSVSARRVAGARLFDIRLFMIQSNVPVQNLDLSPNADPGGPENQIVITVE